MLTDTKNAPPGGSIHLVEKLIKIMDRRLTAIKRRWRKVRDAQDPPQIVYQNIVASSDTDLENVAQKRRMYLDALRRDGEGTIAFMAPEFWIMAKIGSFPLAVNSPSIPDEQQEPGRLQDSAFSAPGILNELAETSPMILLGHDGHKGGEVFSNMCEDIFQAMPSGMFLYRFEEPDKFVLEECNPAAEWLTGISIEQYRGRNFESIWPCATSLGIKDAFLRVLFSGETFEAEDVCHKDYQVEGSFLIKAFAIPGRRLVVVLENITNRKITENHFRHMALHDALTGLANRFKLHDRIQHALQMAKRWPKNLIAVMFLDLDRFKLVNDTFGHAMGDALLVEVGRRLCACVRSHDTVCRYGGDEFVVHLEEISSGKDALITARRICEALSHPYVLNSHTLSIGASVGVSLSPFASESPEEPVRQANMAMHRAKEMGGGIRFFTKKMLQKSVTVEKLEGDLERAIDRKEFRLLFQPIVDTGKNGHKPCVGSGQRIRGFEVLLRWSHPQKGIINPMDFLPLAEESGKISRIGSWVLDKACETLAGWRREGADVEGLFFSINVSPRELAWVDFVGSLSNSLEAHSLPPEQIRLEIGESAIMKSNAALYERIRELSDQGVGLSLDDFGTGYSNIALLGRLQLAGVKIDTSITRALEHFPQNGSLIRAITTMAESLGLDVVAEGVETQGQRRILLENGCRMQQGFYYSKPLFATEAARFLAKDYQDSGLCY